MSVVYCMYKVLLVYFQGEVCPYVVVGSRLHS